VIFLDDNAIPEQDWLDKLNSAIQTLPDLVVVGGQVSPVWPYPPPKWCTPELFPALSLCDYETISGECRILDFPREYPVGANIAFKKEALSDFGGFNTDLGRIGDLLLSGEETEIIYRLMSAGHSNWYCPGAKVHHLISQDRQTKKLFRESVEWYVRIRSLIYERIFGNWYVFKKVIQYIILGYSYNLVKSLISST
jgi:GT2 family glycosyltransferase